MRRFADVVAMAAVYYGAAQAGLLLAVAGTNVSPIWPATGVALAAVVWRGPHMAAGVFIGEMVANMQVFLGDGAGLPVALGVSIGFAVGNSGEALIGGFLYKRWVRSPHATRSLASTWGLARTAAVMCLASVALGVASLWTAGTLPVSAIPVTAATWWLGNVAGVALLTPLLLELVRPRELTIAPMGRVEATLLLAGAIGLPVLIFSGLLQPVGLENPLLLVAVVLWPAFRSTPFLTSLTMALVAMLSISSLALAAPTAFTDGDLIAFGLSTATGGFLVLIATSNLQDRLTAHKQANLLTRNLERAVEREGRAAKEASLRRDAILQNAMEGIVTVDDRMVIVEVNPSAEILLGAESRALVGEHLQTHCPDCSQPSNRPQRVNLSGGIPVEASWTSWSLGGAQFHTAFLRDLREELEAEQGRRDAAEAERALQSMAEQAEFRTEFLNHAAHEIRTPMTPLLLQVSILRHHQNEMPPGAAKSVNSIQRNLSRLKRILDDMLDVGRFQAGRLEIHPTVIDIAPVIEHSVHDHLPVLEEKKITVTTRIDDPCLVHADGDRIHQILGNLLGNAAKYTPAGGNVSVHVRHRLGAVEVRVADDGLGLDEDQISRLFQPFSRVHPAEAIPGTGLGLYVSQSLARLHQGDLIVESDGPGKGACFTLRLPAPEAMEHQYSDSSPGLATTSGLGMP